MPVTAGPAVGRDLGVERDRLVIARSLVRGDEVLDVVIDGRRAWSFRPQDSGVATPESWEVPWPGALRRRLDGYGDVSVIRHMSGEAVAPGVAVRWSERPFQLINDHGEAMAVDKWGRLVVPFGSKSAASRQRTLDHLQVVMEAVERLAERPTFLVSGTLLGAVREGRLLDHDDDVDVGYLSGHEHPALVALEQIRLRRALVSAGFDVVTHSYGHLQIPFLEGAELDHYVDIFTCFYSGGRFHQPFHVRGDVPLTSVLPLGERELEGRWFSAPRLPEALLSVNYGPFWRTPDPAFRLETPPGTRRRFSGWFGDMLGSQEAWNARYADELKGRRRFADRDPQLPDWVLGARAVVDLGCGSGDVTVRLASQGLRSVGVDSSSVAIRMDAELARRLGSRATFVRANLNDPRDALEVGVWMARLPRPLAVISRGMIDEMPPRAYGNLADTLRIGMRRGDRALLEWRGSDTPAGIGSLPVDSERLRGVLEERHLAVSRRGESRAGADKDIRQTMEVHVA